MAIDMNGDIGEIFKNIFSKKDGKTDTTEGNSSKPKDPFVKVVTAGGVFFLLIILYLFVEYFPTQEENRIKREKIAQINDLSICIAKISDDVVIASKELSLAQGEYKRLTKLFHTGQELDDLYRHISMLALSNQLMVVKINKVGESPVFESQEELTDGSENFNMEFTNDMALGGDPSACDLLQGGDMSSMDDGMLNNQDFQDPMAMDEMSSDGESKPKKVAYYELKVEFEISGDYANYTKFREGLAKLKKIINITKEKIIVLESEGKKGEVRVETIFSIYRIPVTESEKYATPQEEAL